MPESAETPKVFISYSHSSPEHKKWVRELANDLMENGVKVIVDFWDLEVGHDIHVFMEQMVSDLTISKVIMICDKQYAQKADDRERGVGIEAEIISGKIYNKTKQGKFISVFSEVDEEGNPYLPIYCKSRLGINMSEGQYKEGLNQLLMTIYNVPQHKKPKLGKKPDFANVDVAIRSSKFLVDEVCDSIRSDKNNASGLLEEYFEEFTKSMEQFYLYDRTVDFELTTQNIKEFLPYRDEIIKVFLHIARYLHDEKSIQVTHNFFERVLRYYDTHWKSDGAMVLTTKADNFKFLIHEMFLYAIAAFIKQEKFECVAYLTNKLYYVPNNSSSNQMVSFTYIRQYAESLYIRNHNKKLGRASLRADFLMDRADISAFDRKEIIQADFVLTIKDATSNSNSRRFGWYSETCIYSNRYYPLEIFARAQSQTYFDKIKIMLGIETNDDLLPIVQGFSGMREGQYEYGHSLANIENLCQTP